MTSKTRNIIIFVVVAVIFFLIYVFFTKSSSSQGGLVSTSPTATLPDVTGTATGVTGDQTAMVGQDFLTLLLSVKSIKLNDAIFSDIAFNNLHDSSITLTQDGTEGRPNPFAKFGSDVPVTSPTTNTTTPATIPSSLPASTTIPTSGTTPKP